MQYDLEYCTYCQNAGVKGHGPHIIYTNFCYLNTDVKISFFEEYIFRA